MPTYLDGMNDLTSPWPKAYQDYVDKHGDAWMKPIRTQEVDVDASTWSQWVESAREARTASQIWGLVTGLLVGLISAVLGLTLLPAEARISVIFYAPLVSWGVFVVVRGRTDRRRFSEAASDMRTVLVPELMQKPDDSALHALVVHGFAFFLSDSVIGRVREHSDGFLIRADEYSLDAVAAWSIPSTYG
jgi:hypothetical protein